MIKKFIESSLKKTNATLELMRKDPIFLESVQQAAQILIDCFQSENKIMFAGNGGSAADAQHMSAEFVSRFMFDRPGLPAIALTTDTSALTAIGNDYGFDQLFSRQIQALGKKGDVLIAYSTSGKSPNILEGLKQARKLGLITIGFTGVKEGDDMVNLCDMAIKIPSDSTPYIQEGHLVIGHILCGVVEEFIFGNATRTNLLPG